MSFGGRKSKALRSRSRRLGRYAAALSLAMLGAVLWASLGLNAVTGPLQGRTTVTCRASVIDGDTIEIRGERIRIFGIDAPESNQHCERADSSVWPCGRQAAFALADRIGSAPIHCQMLDTDPYGRAVARCEQDDDDLGAWMVRKGLAVAYRQYSQDYVTAESEARAVRRGLWQGAFELPWDWCHQRNYGPKAVRPD